LNKVGFVITGEFGMPQFTADLEREFVFSRDKPTREVLSVYDSFDWRLYQRGLTLFRHGENLELQRTIDGVVVSSLALKKDPGFVWDIPDGMLKNDLEPILGVRKLVKIFDGEKYALRMRILNQDQKTVARLLVEGIQTAENEAEDKNHRAIWAIPVRGYPRYHKTLINFLQSFGYPEFNHDEAYRVLLNMVGRTPGDYNPKLDTIQLSPDMRADEATKVILRFTLSVMKSNEPGIQADLDTENLHDYRVAVRRTRSALTQIRGVFPPDVVAYFREGFSGLGKLTNKQRDMDVYLLKEDAYRQVLPDSLKGGIDPLFVYLKSERSRALKEVKTGLNSDDYRSFLLEWDDFLSTGPPTLEDDSTPNASKPVINLAKKRIYKRYRKVIRDGESILMDPQVEDEKLHALRIECKKLRYLLEFCASLFPFDEVHTLVKQLKYLQDNLGDFNDFVVQSNYLIHIGQELMLDGDALRFALASIGCLVGHLEDEKDIVRNEFGSTFRSFAAKDNQLRYRKLFRDGGAR
jgi:CHAD domain-containing protein